MRRMNDSAACMIEITPWPKFSGEQEDWAHFKWLMKEMMRISGRKESLRLAQLLN